MLLSFFADLADIPIFTLSGTSGAPNSSTCTTTATSSATAVWSFRTGGGIVYDVACANTTWMVGVEWMDAAHKPPTDDLWIRADNDSGSNPNAGGPALGVWHRISGTGQANREWGYFQGGFDPPYPKTYTGVIRVRIATDSGGVNVVAEGFYEGIATVNP